MANDWIIEKRYNSGYQFLQDITFGGDFFFNEKKNFIYRGQSTEDYKLIPTALRMKIEDLVDYALIKADEICECETFQIMAESQILHEFYERCDYNNLYVPSESSLRMNVVYSNDYKNLLTPTKWLSDDLFEIAGIAQHYGVPTRLLDWTYSINVAIYFAISDYFRNESLFGKTGNIVIWVLDITITKPMFVNQFVNQSIGNGLDIPLRFIRPSYNGNPNLAAQRGLFSLWQISRNRDTSDSIDREPLDEKLLKFIQKDQKMEQLFPKPLMYKLVIPNNDIFVLYQYLLSQNINASSLFPGYAGVKRAMDENLVMRKHMPVGRQLYVDENQISISTIKLNL